MENSIYSFIGLATKAGRLFSGEDTCERKLRSGKVELLILAVDASANTKDKFTGICASKGVNLRIFGVKELLGRRIGKDVRSVLAITDKQFAGRTIEMIDSFDKEFGGEQYGKNKSV